MKKIVYLLMAIMLTASVSFAQSKPTKNTERFKYPVLVQHDEVIEIGFVSEYTWNYLIQSKSLKSNVVYQDIHPDDISTFERLKTDVDQLQEYCFVYLPKNSGNKTPMIKEGYLTLLDLSYEDALKLIN